MEAIREVKPQLVEDELDLILGKTVSNSTLPTLVKSFKPEYLDDEERLSTLNGTPLTKVFLIGYPCEVGIRNQDGRAGTERGPDSIREIMSLAAMPANPVTAGTVVTGAAVTGQSKIDGKVEIYDCGNIHVDQGRAIHERDTIMDQAGNSLS